MARHRTMPACPRSVAVHSPVATSHTLRKGRTDFTTMATHAPHACSLSRHVHTVSMMGIMVTSLPDGVIIWRRGNEEGAVGAHCHVVHNVGVPGQRCDACRPLLVLAEEARESLARQQSIGGVLWHQASGRSILRQLQRRTAPIMFINGRQTFTNVHFAAMA